jgi:hypothetical protein
MKNVVLREMGKEDEAKERWVVVVGDRRIPSNRRVGAGVR